MKKIVAPPPALLRTTTSSPTTTTNQHQLFSSNQCRLQSIINSNQLVDTFDQAQNDATAAAAVDPPFLQQLSFDIDGEFVTDLQDETVLAPPVQPIARMNDDKEEVPKTVAIMNGCKQISKKDITVKDFVAQQGTFGNTHEGSNELRELMESDDAPLDYAMATSNAEKANIADKYVDVVLQDRRGRFVKWIKELKAFFVVPRNHAFLMIEQKLRDAVNGNPELKAIKEAVRDEMKKLKEVAKKKTTDAVNGNPELRAIKEAVSDEMEKLKEEAKKKKTTAKTKKNDTVTPDQLLLSSQWAVAGSLPSSPLRTNETATSTTSMQDGPQEVEERQETNQHQDAHYHAFPPMLLRSPSPSPPSPPHELVDVGSMEDGFMANMEMFSIFPSPTSPPHELVDVGLMDDGLMELMELRSLSPPHELVDVGLMDDGSVELMELRSPSPPPSPPHDLNEVDPMEVYFAASFSHDDSLE